MICEAYLARRVNGLAEDALADIVRTFRTHFPDYHFKAAIDAALIDLMKNDKKNVGNQIGFALPPEIGKCSIDVFVGEDLIKESLGFYRELIAAGIR